jgi:hypothetical protein
MEKLRGRAFKKNVLKILESDNFKNDINDLLGNSESSVVNALFASIYNTDPKIKWHAVSSFGLLAQYYEKENMTKVRDILRRCIWMLTEESGGIAWGAPEVIGEIITVLPKITKEYTELLLSYVYEDEDDNDNYLEFVPFRKGVYWGILRIASEFPELIAEQKKVLIKRIDFEDDEEILAYIWLIGKAIQSDEIIKKLSDKELNGKSFEFYIQDKFEEITIKY